ncbi:helix-turn-helix domain-containing protein [Mycolicibacterium llatzerense]|uniref:helix-turn-helix domain-containing protein n=1 Tax=Mycolicibacterium llatzerense TaxID=280871 RepID=UPI0008DDCF2C|nr:helix-turn-helix domain-containing protein [Mycolicibacterium llatzerense]
MTKRNETVFTAEEVRSIITGMQAADGDPLLTAQEAADQLRLSLRTTLDLLRTGELAGTKAGRRCWRVRQSAIDEFLGKPAIVGPASLGKGAIERLAELLRDSPTWLFDSTVPVPAGLEPLHGVLAGAAAGGAA